MDKKNKKETQKSFILDMLRKKPCTIEELAIAIMKKGLMETKPLKKAKSGVAVVVCFARKKDKMNIIKIDADHWKLEE